MNQTSAVSIVVIGGMGRLGRAIVEETKKQTDVKIRGVVVRSHQIREAKGCGVSASTVLSKVVTQGDVVIDATLAKNVAKNLRNVVALRVPYVIASTGLDPKTRQKINLASQKIPIIVAPNLSLGVAVLKEITSLTASLLPEVDVEIVETHHRNKMDAPSGTALSLSAAIMEGSGLYKDLELGRPRHGKREHGSIGIHAVRGGDVVGEHVVQFLLDGERVELRHLATSRSIFAAGAIRAAKYLASVQPGLYTMRDVLGLEKMKI